MPFCPFCGTSVKDQHKFCPNCGNQLEQVTPRPVEVSQPVQSPQQAYAPAQPYYAPPPAPQSMPYQVQGETIRALIPNLMVSKSLGRVDTYNLIVYERRSIFAKLTNEVMNNAIKRRRAKAEDEGKGFFGKWKAQMQGFNIYTDGYSEMTSDQILAETQGNWAIDNSAIRGMKFSADNDDEGGQNFFYVELTTMTGKLNFKTTYDAKSLFNNAYSSR
jgi:hypothetical protein